MGGLSTVASTAIQALSVANSVMGAANSYQNNSGRLEYEQQKRKAELEMQNALSKAENDKAQIRAAADIAENERRDSLRRAMARQRAKFGASGTDASTGSGQAVLLGLFDESEEERQKREALDTLKTNAIEQNLDQQKRINTLQLAQLKEKNKYNRYTSAFNAIGGLLG